MERKASSIFSTGTAKLALKGIIAATVLSLAACASTGGTAKNVDAATIHGFAWGADKTEVMASLADDGAKEEEGNIISYKTGGRDTCTETFTYSFNKENQLYAVSVVLSSGLALNANTRQKNQERVRARTRNRVDYFVGLLGQPDDAIGYDLTKTSFDLDITQTNAEWEPEQTRAKLPGIGVKVSFSNISNFFTFVETYTNPGILSEEERLGEKLMIAVLESDVEATQSLLTAGANPGYVDTRGLTPLFMDGFPSFNKMVSMTNEQRSDFYHRKEIIYRMLIDKGADVNATTRFRNGLFPTPLLSYVYSYGSGLNPSMVQLLIDSGADVNAVSAYKGNMTALHIAVDQHRPEATKMLIQAGADINATLSDGVTTPFLLAITQDKKIDDVNVFVLGYLLEANPARTELEERLYDQIGVVQAIRITNDLFPTEEGKKALQGAIIPVKETLELLRAK